MAKKDEVVAKKTTKVSIYVGNHGSATIVREDGMPQIIDKTENAVAWLVAKEFKPADIELVGEKPSIWNKAFNIEVEEPATVEAPIAA